MDSTEGVEEQLWRDLRKGVNLITFMANADPMVLSMLFAMNPDTFKIVNSILKYVVWKCNEIEKEIKNLEDQFGGEND